MNESFVIARGTKRPSYFSFFVDSTGACWSQSIGNARLFEVRDDAEADIKELRDRDKRRVRERAARK